MNDDHPVYAVEPDDAVHRFQARFIEMRGAVMPVQARYVMWAVWAVFTVLLWAPLGLVYDGAEQIVFTLAFAAAATAAVAGKITADVSPLTVAETAACWAHTTWAKTRRRPAPVRVTIPR